jgi:hypothetical protein
MYQAILNNKIISSVEFNNKYPNYKELGIYATCPICQTKLWLVAGSSIAKNHHFKHRKNIDCSWSNSKTNLSFKRTEDGIRFKKEFCNKENIIKTYIVLKNIAGEFVITHNVYLDMLRDFDRRNIWSYANLTIKLLPYVILSTYIFKSKNKNGDDYFYHYTINKTKMLLEKRFIKSGDLVKGYNSVTNIPDLEKHTCEKTPYIDFKWFVEYCDCHI